MSQLNTLQQGQWSLYSVGLARQEEKCRGYASGRPFHAGLRCCAKLSNRSLFWIPGCNAHNMIYGIHKSINISIMMDPMCFFEYIQKFTSISKLFFFFSFYFRCFRGIFGFSNRSEPTNSLLKENSVLGWALSPSALDSALVPPSRAHLTEAGIITCHQIMGGLSKNASKCVITLEEFP